jgi:6-phosphogluconolactonase (cycloisomerase 2 family)
MKHRALLAVLLAAVLATLVSARAASPDPGRGQRGPDLVFVQTNEVTGNRIVVFHRADDGRLTEAGRYATGGNGGVALPGNESDRLASQGSLVYDSGSRLLLAVNAGSDSISAFSVQGDRLQLLDVLPSGGGFPASIAVHGRLVYVLNAGGRGTVQGFRILPFGLRPIPHSARDLGLANTDPPDFLTSPGQVGFTPDGSRLIVTTKASGSLIDVFQVLPNGRLSETPVRNPSATPVPFAFTFAPTGRLVMGEDGASTVTTYVVNPEGTLSDPKSLGDNQVALCWIQRVGRFYYVSNTGSDTLGGYEISAAGQPALVTSTGVVAHTTPGPIDLTSPTGTSFLYAQTGSGSVHEFRVNADGTLTQLGVIGGLPVGMEGIAST